MSESKAASKIIGVQFSMLSPEEIRKNSVVEVTSRDTYINNKPVIGGLFDPRMGVLEPGTICPTDGMSYIDTPGYFGHIELARPVFFIQHLKEIMKIARCICFKCSKLLINKQQHQHILEKKGEDRWDYVFPRASKAKRCGDSIDDGCGCKQPDKIKLEGMANIYAIWDELASGDKTQKQKVVIKLTPEIVIKLFQRISDEDVHFMGFSPLWSRPDWMVCQVLPIAPPAVRPSVKHDAQQRSEDDLTHIYSNIIKTNNFLKDKLSSGMDVNASAIEMSTEILQHSIAMIANNKIKGVAPMAQRSGRPLQCIMGRINSKNGRIRGNLMGKRVDFSARSVITGDPNLSIRQLGVPLKIAKNITKPVVVNDRNRAFLIQLVRNGPDEWPGAKIVERKNGINVSLRYVDRESLSLENGDTVHRHMMDGDMVLFNRQPSLHRMSMMGHVAKIMHVGDTFRMNVGDTKPYNADFDGDEMNMHMPQSVTAETELKHLAAIPYQMISPTNNTPIIGIFQDSLLGAYRFTRPDITFTLREAMNLLVKFPRMDLEALKACGPEISSFQILSQIFPKMSMKYKTKLFDDDRDKDISTSNNVMELVNGQYLRGQMEKSVLGSGTKGLLHRICNDFGIHACANFNDDLQNIVTEYMKTSSFSVGMSDLMADQTTHMKILDIIENHKLDVQKLIDRVHLGIFENNTAATNKEYFETQVNNVLNEATNEAGKVGNKSLSKDNRFVMIVESGSKGNAINITQMISCLGQQNVDGKRIPYGFDSRTLPHYTKFDDSPNARGFVENSYISGLTAQELFFHAMGGRVGLIDTAVKTSNTGYVQRRLIKGLEDLKLEYDMTVRNSKGKIIQFAYGDDGFDSTKVESQNLPFLGMTVSDIYQHYDMSDESVYTQDAKKRMQSQSEELMRKCKQYSEDLLEKRDQIVAQIFRYKNESSVVVPVNFQYLMATIQGQLALGKHSAVDITPLETFQLVEEYYTQLRTNACMKTNELFEIIYKYYLTPRELLVFRRFHRAGLIILLEMITLKFKEAIVHPGEMVGVVAGQAVGEPSTQLTLNSIIWSEIIILRNKIGCIKSIPIGQFTEEQILRSQHVKVMEDKDTTYAELSSEDDYYEVPCANEAGETVWRRVEAVTQHPVINEDGTNTMIKVCTKGGREVTATKAKSFLQLVDGKIQGVLGQDLKVGDFLPVSRKPLSYAETNTLDLRTIFPPSEYLYGTELAKAAKLRGERHWWKIHANKSFVLPHSSSQSLAGLFTETPQKGKTPCKYLDIHAGYIYMKSMGCCGYKIPETMEMNYDFGYLVGAYAAEGNADKNHVNITNNCDEYLAPIEDMCKAWNVPYNKRTRLNRGGDGWKSQEFTIHNSILGRLMIHLCGTLSYNKHISPTIVFSNRECILGFLSAYIGGDGSINKVINKDGSVCVNKIQMWSTSYQMLQDVMVMLKNLGVASNINKIKERKATDHSIQHRRPSYSLDVKNRQAQKLASMLRLTVPEKQERLNILRSREDMLFEYSKHDEALPNIIEGELVMEPRNGRMMDMQFDPIVSIEEVANTTPYAYDLTVEETRNFDIYNGLALRDTFHGSGIGSKSNVTRGVPRIEEILRLTKNPKSTSMMVCMRAMDEVDKDKASILATELEHTRLVDVVKAVQICFDPDEKLSNIVEDQALLEQFYEFERTIQGCLEPATSSSQEPTRSKWIVRMEFSTEKLLEKNITMDDIHFAITNSQYGNDAHCVFSDYNRDGLIFRIRMNASVFHKSTKKKGPEPLDQSDEIYLLKHFQDNLLNHVVLRGIHGIRNVQVRKLQNMVTKEEGKFVPKEAWYLDTTGTNLLETLGLDYIDYTRTITNDIKEVFHVLGIEAARQVIYNELTDVMEFSGVYINYHHTSLLCDRMTCNKDMVSIFRSGLLNDDVGPIAKATFEVHTEVLLGASRHADVDHMRGVSANIMCGQHGCYGTGAFNLVLDMKAMSKVSAQGVKERVNLDDMVTKVGKPDDGCARGVMEMNNNIVHIPEMATVSNVCLDDYDAGF